ncbi:MAG: N-acetylglucosaminyl-diphospho-decaprenol L-rhamnosyltransferase [Planctomycetota bacterium]
MSESSQDPAFSVIVVSYGTRLLTLDCLRSLYAETSAPAFEVIVVDNASDDGSAEAIAEAFPQAELLALDENLGFGAANNLAAERAKGRRFLLLNPDTVVQGRALEALWQDSEANPDAGIWGGRTLFADGTLNRSSCWGAPTPWSALCLALGLASAFPSSAFFHPEGLGLWPRDTAREVPIVSGCLMLVDAQLWRRLGGFHVDFFMYGEDADLCLRARAEGAAPRITPAATIVHLGGASERARAGKMVRLFTAKAQLYAKFWGSVPGRFGLFTLDLWALHRFVAFSLLGLVRPAKRSSRDTWRDVWFSRGTWHAAFDRTEPYGGARQ